MALSTVLLSLLLSFFSTTVMSYISMATPIGPWIAPTLVLLLLVISKFLKKSLMQEEIVLPVVAGSVGGIMATACGFSFPTLYFLNPVLFNEWLLNPLFFSATLSFLTLSSGLLAFWMSDVTSSSLLLQKELSFPIAQLIGGMIAKQDQELHARKLSLGCFVSWGIALLSSGLEMLSCTISSVIPITQKYACGIFTIPALVMDLDIAPMLLAIGYVTGHVIALPLFVGVCSRILFVDPCATVFFSDLSFMEVSMAFCSGIVLIGAGVDLFAVIKQSFYGMQARTKNHFFAAIKDFLCLISFANIPLFFFTITLFFGVFLFFEFPWYVILYLIGATLICSYQMTVIAGRVGLAYLGRFATFVMVPAMLLFSIDNVHIVFIAATVELAGGMMVDFLCGKKVGVLCGVDLKKVRKYQLLGLLASSIIIGFVFYHLLTAWPLGSGHLFAYKAQSRQLLINARYFDVRLLALGAVYGWFLRRIKINPGLVLGGLLMPVATSLMLIAGGFCAVHSKQKDAGISFWSGVFTGNSLWIFVRAFLK